MSAKQRIDCLWYFRHRYKQAASKTEKSKILDEVCTLYNYNRKAAIRQLNRPVIPDKKQRRGPKPTYEPDVYLPILKTFWFAADQPCSKRLKALIPHWLPFYEQEHGELETEVREGLLVVSSATLDRLLKPVRVELNHKGRSGTKPGSLIKQHIPIKVEQWDEKKPGFLEADTVALCGQSLLGNFVWCITMTDIASGWTECRATWNKGAHGVLQQLKCIESTLPFDILGFDCDNGSEFLNWQLVKHYQNREQPVQFTRSRPYKKNDNAHVEQKNWTHIRQLFGYDRFERPHLVELMNDLLINEFSLLQNHFMPSSKLISKNRLNSKYVKNHDKPKTPYERLMTSNHLPNKYKVHLAMQHKLLNPFVLQRQIQQKLKIIFQYVSVTPNVRHRL